MCVWNFLCCVCSVQFVDVLPGCHHDCDIICTHCRARTGVTAARGGMRLMFAADQARDQHVPDVSIRQVDCLSLFLDRCVQNELHMCCCGMSDVFIPSRICLWVSSCVTFVLNSCKIVCLILVSTCCMFRHFSLSHKALTLCAVLFQADVRSADAAGVDGQASEVQTVTEPDNHEVRGIMLECCDCCLDGT